MWEDKSNLPLLSWSGMAQEEKDEGFCCLSFFIHKSNPNPKIKWLAHINPWFKSYRVYGCPFSMHIKINSQYNSLEKSKLSFNGKFTYLIYIFLSFHFIIFNMMLTTLNLLITS